MIEFRGYTALNCKKHIIKKSIKATIIAEIILCILLGIPSILAIIFFDIWIFLLLVLIGLLVGFFLSLSAIKENRPYKIVLDEDEIYIEFTHGATNRKIEDVKTIIDFGKFYDIVFYFPNQFSFCICEKDLIVEGTIEEFEKLFEDKIVRKYETKD